MKAVDKRILQALADRDENEFTTLMLKRFTRAELLAILKAYYENDKGEDMRSVVTKAASDGYEFESKEILCYLIYRELVSVLAGPSLKMHGEVSALAVLPVFLLKVLSLLSDIEKAPKPDKILSDVLKWIGPGVGVSNAALQLSNYMDKRKKFHAIKAALRKKRTPIQSAASKKNTPPKLGAVPK